MKTIRKTLADATLLVLLGAVLALASNQVRDAKHIRPFKNAYAKGLSSGSPAKSEVSSSSQLNPPSVAAEAVTGSKPPTLVHPYQKISFDEIAELYADPATVEGVNLIIDARRPEVFAKGHIPGAVQCYPHEAERSLRRILDQVDNVEKIIVYCNGGDCEDSGFMCRELIEEFEVPFTKVFLFEGGYNEWTENQMPFDTEEETP